LGILYDIIHAYSLDGDTTTQLAAFALSEHRFYSMSVFNVYDFYDNKIDLIFFINNYIYTYAYIRPMNSRNQIHMTT